MIVGRLDSWQESFDGPIWSSAFKHLAGLKPDSLEEDIVLSEEGLLVRVMSYPTRYPEEAVLEAHDKHIDIQTALVNSEGIDWFPRGQLQTKTPYDTEKDVIFFHRPPAAPARISVYPGTFVVLFPQDAHMPRLVTGSEPEVVKKAVVKVPLHLVKKQC